MTPAGRPARALLLLLPLASLAAFVGWSDPSPEPTAMTGALTGEKVYLRAVHAMRAVPQPKYVIFHESLQARNLKVTCSHGEADLGLRHGDTKAEYRVWYRAKDGDEVSVDLATNERCDGASLIAPVDSNWSADYFGARPTPTPAQSTVSGPPLIASVRAEAARFYRITLAGTETFEGHPVYRLALHAYRDPQDHPLTGMLVDTQSSLVRQLTGEVSIHFVIASGWGGGSITFDQAGPYWVARDEHVEFAANAIVVHARAAFDVHASDFGFPDDLPGVFPSPSPTAARRGKD